MDGWRNDRVFSGKMKDLYELPGMALVTIDIGQALVANFFLSQRASVTKKEVLQFAPAV